LKVTESVFIDAGANVGYTTVYFSQLYNFDKIFAIEPSIENIKILKQNIEKLYNLKNITVYQKALAHTENSTFNIDKSFRDQKDWSIATVEDPSGNIEGITINEIITSNNLKHITLLKIDIEGAERFIFNKENDLTFLNIVKVLAVEIHDEYNIREEVYDLLIKNNFIIFESGELTVAINKKFI
jgi:FkbM family methyltransferase